MTNDLKESCEIELDWKIMNSEGVLLLKGVNSSTILPCSSLKLESVDVSNLNTNQSSLQNNIVFYKLNRKGKIHQLIHRGFRLFDAPKSFKLKDANITYSWEDLLGERNTDNLFRLNLKANEIALYVFITSDLVDFIASDNYFSMDPEETYIIDIEILKVVKDNTEYSKQDILDSFKIRSLYDINK